MKGEFIMYMNSNGEVPTPELNELKSESNILNLLASDDYFVENATYVIKVKTLGNFSNYEFKI